MRIIILFQVRQLINQNLIFNHGNSTNKFKQVQTHSKRLSKKLEFPSCQVNHPDRENLRVGLSSVADSTRDLAGADLRGVKSLRGQDLRKYHLSGADLRGADLSGTNLAGVDLIRANLRGAKLKRTNLNEAYLGNTDLTKANLRGASLQQTNLKEANLVGANLSRVNLKTAYTKGANFD